MIERKIRPFVEQKVERVLDWLLDRKGDDNNKLKEKEKEEEVMRRIGVYVEWVRLFRLYEEC